MEVADGTKLTVRYVDASACGPAGVAVEATAMADCTAPTITAVQMTAYGSGARISWHTDEPTVGKLFYGTTSLSHTLVETAAATDHAVVVAGLSYCTDHIFAVEATDAAGNTARADNGGANYAFTTLGADTSGMASTDVPKAIPDYSGTGVYSTLTVDSPYTVAGVTVTVNVIHPWVGDVALTLVHPDGQTWVRLAEKEGGGGDGYWNTTFDDGAPTAIYEGQPPFTGSFRPESPLAKFAGMPAAGTWRLYAHDLGRDDVGTLMNWSMTLTLDVPCTPDFRAHASADPVSAFVPVTVTFTGSAENGTPPYTYAWDFGDGHTGVGANPGHTYTNGGSYTVTLTATDAAAHTAVHTLAVNASSTVAPPAIASIVKKGNPFRLDITGSDFHSACEVRIDGVAAPQTKVKTSTRVLAKGGGSLKAMVPKGQTVMVTVVNTDDGGISAPFPFSW